MGSDSLYGVNNTGLELGLGFYQYQHDQDHNHHDRENKKRSTITMSFKCDHLLPSDLTLGPMSSSDHDRDDHNPDHDLDHQSSPVSTEKSAGTSAVSSFSNSSASTTVVKRDRDVISSEEVETKFERSLASRRVISGTNSDVNSQINEDHDILDQGSPRKKLRLTKQQSSLLEDSFKEHATLNPKQKQDLARQLNLRPRQVEVWFQNRRARTKLKQTEADYEQWKKCCEALTEENKRLQKELHELKSLNLITAPFYMPFPAPPTLTICPSCDRLGRGGGGGGGGDSTTRILIRPKATHHLNISNSYTTTTTTTSETAC